MWVGLLISYVTNVANVTMLQFAFCRILRQPSRAKAVPLHRISSALKLQTSN